MDSTICKYDRVALATDPERAPGSVIAVAITGVYVRWDVNGRQWVYQPEDLVKLS